MRFMAVRFLRLLWQRPTHSSLFPLPPGGLLFREVWRSGTRVQPAVSLLPQCHHYSTAAGTIDSLLGSMKILQKKVVTTPDDICVPSLSNDSDVTSQSEDSLGSGKKFSDFSISPWIVTRLDELGFGTAFEVQEKTLPLTLDGRDVIVRAVTGSGKTLAFAVPIIHILSNSPRTRHPRAIVITPTRELCIQVSTCIQSLSKKVRCVSLYGGASYRPQEDALYRGVDVICATPGRLGDHFERGNFGLSDVKFLILDEGDELLTPNFKEQINCFLEDCPKEKQMMLFSATMPNNIKQLAKTYMKEPVVVNLVSNRSLVPTSITHEAVRVNHHRKAEVVANLLLCNKPERTIVFTTTRAQSAELSRVLNTLGIQAHFINSDLSQNAREACLQRFRDGKTSVLVATDVAARGIDVPETDMVIQVEPPPNGVDFYIHRAGRTGRKGKPGRAILLFSDKDRYFMREVSRIVDMNVVRPPDSTAVIEGAIQSTVKAAKGVDSDMLKWATEEAQKLFEEKGVDALAATLVLAANVKEIADLSPRRYREDDGDSYSRRGDGYSRRGGAYSSRGDGYSRRDYGYSRRGGGYSKRGDGYSKRGDGYSKRGDAYSRHGDKYSTRRDTYSGRSNDRYPNRDRY